MISSPDWNDFMNNNNCIECQQQSLLTLSIAEEVDSKLAFCSVKWYLADAFSID